MFRIPKISIRERFVGLSVLILITSIIVLNIYKYTGAINLQDKNVSKISSDLTYLIGMSISQDILNEDYFLLEAKLNDILHSIDFIVEISVRGLSDEIIAIVKKDKKAEREFFHSYDIFKNTTQIGNVKIAINPAQLSDALTSEQYETANNLIYINLLTALIIILLVNISIIDPIESISKLIHTNKSESSKHIDKHVITINELRKDAQTITKQRLDQDNELISAKQQLAAVLSTIGEAIITINSDSEIIMANKAAEMLWGYTKDEIANKNLIFMMPEKFRDMHLRGLNSYLETGVSKIIDSRVEVIGLHSSGREFPMELHISETLIDNKTYFTAAARDITNKKQEETKLIASKKHTELMLEIKTKELKNAQMLLIQAEKLETIGTLAAGVAHEVKNPLAIIQLGIDYLKRSVNSEQSESVEILNDMRNAIHRADYVIKELMDFSAARNINKAPVDLIMVLKESIRLTSHELVKEKIHVENLHVKENLIIDVDKLKIMQVFINIIMNSVHAMSKTGGTIYFKSRVYKGDGVDFDISASRLYKGPIVVVEIEDTGPGVEINKLSKISEPFYTSKKAGKGTGLGLTVCENIIRLHNAKMEFYNNKYGGFGVRLVFNEFTGDHNETA